MGELTLSLLLITSLNLQQSQPLIPVAHAQEVRQEASQPIIPPILEKVALCESGGRHYDSTGKVIRGKVDKRDIGKWQINSYWNGAEAERLGFDIWTPEGNQAMALHLYQTQGLKPWDASRSCWSAKI
jgi:hypothetical protein